MVTGLRIGSPRASTTSGTLKRGQDTEPGGTFFQVYFSMLEKVHDPIFTRIDLDIDVGRSKALDGERNLLPRPRFDIGERQGHGGLDRPTDLQLPRARVNVRPVEMSN